MWSEYAIYVLHNSIYCSASINRFLVVFKENSTLTKYP